MPPSPHKRKRSESTSESEHPPPQRARQRKGPAELRDRASEKDAAEKEIQYLKDRASKRPGYDDFHANQNRKMKYPERVKFWTFAARFAEDYFKTSSGIIGRLGKKINKESTMALNTGTTVLAEAENATRIIKITDVERGG